MTALVRPSQGENSIHTLHAASNHPHAKSPRNPPTHLKGLPDMRRRGKNHFVVLSEHEKYPMMDWLRKNPEYLREGRHPDTHTSRQLRSDLIRNGWEFHETDTEVHLVYPREHKPTHLKGLPDLTRAEPRDFIVIFEGERYPMMGWLRENPEHNPAGMHPDTNNSHSLFFGLLQKNGWVAEADDEEIRLIFPAEAWDEETFIMDENLAVHRNKMISINISFWTDGIATQENRIVPKHAWAGGVVKTVRNDSHGIRTSADPIPFNTWMELPSAIEKLLIREGILLHLNSKMRRYISQDTE